MAQATITSETLQEQGANDLASALRNASGVFATVFYGTYEYYSVRGFFIDSLQLTDGIRNEGNRMNTQLVNVEQVEILKGPASVLYGGDALGGAINLVRKKPQALPVRELEISAGRWRNLRWAGGSAGSLFGGNRLLYRLDSGLQDTDGFRQAGSRRFNVTPAVTWLPTSRDRLTLHYSLNRDRFDTDSGIPIAALSAPGIPLGRRFNTPQDFALSHDHNLQLQYNRQIGESIELRNTASYRHFNDEYFSAEGLGYAGGSTITREFLYFKHHRRPILNQADLLGRARTGRLSHRYLAGYEYQRFHNWTNRSAAASTATAPIDFLRFEERHVNRSFPLSRIDFFDNQIHALFWQDHITVVPERLTVLVGGRADLIRRWSRNDPVVDGVQRDGTRIDREANAYTWRYGAVYSPVRTWQLYSSASSSFRPLFQVPADGRNLDPESGRNMEVGSRWEPVRGLTVQTALYDLVKRNVAYTVAPQVFVQAGRQSSRGAEIDLNANLTRRWTVVAGYGYANARFDNFRQGALDLSGNLPRFVPLHTTNLWATRFWDNGLRISVGSRYVGPLFTDNRNSVRLGGYTIWDVSAGWRQGRLEYSINAMNLLNKHRFFVGAINDRQVYPGTPLNLFCSIRLRLN
ncbi:MAG: TonB-dependent receptor [Bryobacteraceae bacterium]